MRALEEFFESLISNIRSNQIKSLRGYYGVQVIFVAFLQITPVAMPIVAFITYSSLNGTISAATIFPALALFNILFQPLLILPTAISQLVSAVVSWGRIKEYILCEEKEKNVKKSQTDSNTSISLINCQFKWEEPFIQNVETKKEKGVAPMKPVIPMQERKCFYLKDINIEIPKGQLVAVVGSVGSGKSTFLSAIIEEIPKIQGDMSINGSIAYCAQQPWILTETIKGNIIFGNHEDNVLVNQVMDVCALKNDLSQFQSAEYTQIGEKGVNLSGKNLVYF